MKAETKRGVFRLIQAAAEYGIAKSGRTYNHKLLWKHVRPAGRRVSFDYYPRGRVEIDFKGRPVSG